MNDIDSIDLIHTQHGWIIKNTSDADRYGCITAIKTGFTRHTPAYLVEEIISAQYPKHLIYVIGGR